nr:MAG: hypothetical protein KatS3mg041_0251 [Bacteroidota bacterium]
MIPLLRPRRKPNWELQVAGMVCRACAQAVEAALRRVSGVELVRADSRTGRVLVWGAEVDLDALREAAEAIGYEVVQHAPTAGS